MAGLLDFLNSDDARLGIGLLAAGGPQTDPTKTGLGAALQSAQGSMDAWKKQQVATQLAQAQILDTVAQAQGRAQTAALAQRQQQALAQAFNPDGSFNAQAVPSLALAGVKPEDIGKFADLRNVGQNKVARTIEGTGPNGEPGTYQADDYGNKIGPFMPKWVAPIDVNTGGEHRLVSPVTGVTQNAFANTVSPDAALGSQTTQRGQDMSQQGTVWKAQFEQAAKDDQQKNGPLNDVQAKSLQFGSRMQMSNDILDSLAAQGINKSVPGSNAGWGIGTAINIAQSPERQQLDQAKRNFLTATLRRESGAVIGASEMADGDKQYFPQVGDSAAVIDQKRQNRLLAMQGILAEVPNADARIQSINQRLAATPPVQTASTTRPATTQSSASAADSGQVSKFVTAPDGRQVKAQRGRDGRFYVQTPQGWVPVLKE